MRRPAGTWLSPRLALARGRGQAAGNGNVAPRHGPHGGLWRQRGRREPLLGHTAGPATRAPSRGPRTMGDSVLANGQGSRVTGSCPPGDG